MAKGGSFERWVSKTLSLWWTQGQRDDIYWRATQSGGRATQRMKFGKKTFGSYGDIAAVDPIGQPLLQLWTIELKRGRSHGCIGDVLECARSECQKPFEKALAQAYTSHQQAGSKGWMLISRPDRQIAMVYIDKDTAKLFIDIWNAPCALYSIRINHGKSKKLMKFLGMPLESFLKRLQPSRVVAAAA